MITVLLGTLSFIESKNSGWVTVVMWIELTCGIVLFLERKRRNAETGIVDFDSPATPTKPEKFTKTIALYFLLSSVLVIGLIISIATESINDLPDSTT